MPTSIESLIRRDRWVEARRAIRSQLRTDPDNHWLVTRLGLTYYEQRQYARALEYSARAVTLAPNCPLALWDHAGALQMLGRHTAAGQIYRRLIRRGVKRIANGKCGEGLARARGLVADCHLRLSDSLKAQHCEKQAMSHILRHLDMRGPGCHSIYSLRDLRKKQVARIHKVV
jgi:regulator of sirC expression with transglutaminase-like and TPR domain